MRRPRLPDGRGAGAGGGNVNTDYFSVHAARPERESRRRGAGDEPEGFRRHVSQADIDICLNGPEPADELKCGSCARIRNAKMARRGNGDWFVKFRGWCRAWSERE